MMCCLLVCVSVLTACGKKTTPSYGTPENIIEKESEQASSEQSTPTQETFPVEPMEEQGKETEEVPEPQNTEPNIHFMENTFLATTGAFEGLAAVQDTTSGLWGFVDKTGEYVIAPIYYGAYPFSEGLAAVNVDGDWGFIDTQGTMVLEPIYQTVETEKFENGYVTVLVYDEENGLDKYEMDHQGQKKEEVVDEIESGSRIGIVPENIDTDYHWLISAKSNSDCLLDTEGHLVVDIAELSDGAFRDYYLRSYAQNGLVMEKYINDIYTDAFIDYEGNVLIDFKYTFLSPFKGGKYLLAKDADGTAHLIDTQGNIIRDLGVADEMVYYKTYADNLSAYATLTEREGYSPGSAFYAVIEVFNNQTGEVVHSIDISNFTPEDCLPSVKYFFMEDCFVAHLHANSVYYNDFCKIYDYQGNLLEEFQAEEIAGVQLLPPYLVHDDVDYDFSSLLMFPFRTEDSKISYLVIEN